MPWSTRRRALIGVALGAVLAGAPASAGATSVVLGPTDFTGYADAPLYGCYELMISGSCTVDEANLPAIDPAAMLAAPADGTVTSWSAAASGFADSSLGISLRVARPAPDGAYVDGGGTAEITGFTLSSVPAQPVNLPILAGDLLAARMRCRALSNCYIDVWQKDAPGPGFGSLDALGPAPQVFGANPNRELAYNATVALATPTITAVAPAAAGAAGGQAVLITGRHLAISTAVLFGGVPAQVILGGDDSMVVTAPPHAAGPVGVTVTTAGGTSPAAAFTYIAAPVAPGPPGPGPDRVAPLISNVALAPPAFAAATTGPGFARPGRAGRAGGLLSYRLSEAATTIFTVQRRSIGERMGKRCVAPTARARGRSCTHFTPVGGSASRVDAAGPHTLRFTGRIGGHTLGPAGYRLTLVATDAAGNRSTPHRVGFTIHPSGARTVLSRSSPPARR